MKKSKTKLVGEDDFVANYQVSNFGLVKSIKAGKLLIPFQNKDNEWCVNLKLNGEKKVCLISILVLEAFVSPRLKGYDVVRKDGDVNNNRIENLKWIKRK